MTRVRLCKYCNKKLRPGLPPSDKDSYQMLWKLEYRCHECYLKQKLRKNSSKPLQKSQETIRHVKF